MSRSTTLKQALLAWSRNRASGEPPGAHLSTDRLYEWLLDPSGGDIGEAERHHLIECPQCSAELHALAAGIADTSPYGMQHWDVALPKAAAGPLEWPKTISTEEGRYTIEIRPSLDNPDQGIITVTVGAAYRTDIEGQRLRVVDGNGRLLLSGLVYEGQVSQLIEQGLSQIVPKFVVSTEIRGE